LLQYDEVPRLFAEAALCASFTQMIAEREVVEGDGFASRVLRDGAHQRRQIVCGGEAVSDEENARFGSRGKRNEEDENEPHAPIMNSEAGNRVVDSPDFT
jgi:hypothetical protein